MVFCEVDLRLHEQWAPGILARDGVLYKSIRKLMNINVIPLYYIMFQRDKSQPYYLVVWNGKRTNNALLEMWG